MKKKQSNKQGNQFDWDEEEAQDALDYDSFSLQSLTIDSQSPQNSRQKTSIVSSNTLETKFKLEQAVQSTQDLNTSRKSCPSPSKSNFHLSDSLKNVINNTKFESLKALTNLNKIRSNESSFPVHDYTSLIYVADTAFDVPENTDTFSTLRRVVEGKAHSFCNFKSLNSKKQLLEAAIDSADSSCIVKVVTFLRETLKKEIFVEFLKNYPAAANEYWHFLKSVGKLDDLSIFESIPSVTSFMDQFLSLFKSNMNKLDVENIETLIGKYRYCSFFNQMNALTQSVVDELKFRVAKDESFTNATGAVISDHLPEISTTIPLMDDLILFAMKYISEHDRIPTETLHDFKVNDIQLEYIIIKSCATLAKYSLLKQFYEAKTRGSIFKSKFLLSSASFDNVVYLLRDHGCPEEVNFIN